MLILRLSVQYWESTTSAFQSFFWGRNKKWNYSPGLGLSKRFLYSNYQYIPWSLIYCKNYIFTIKCCICYFHNCSQILARETKYRLISFLRQNLKSTDSVYAWIQILLVLLNAGCQFGIMSIVKFNEFLQKGMNWENVTCRIGIFSQTNFQISSRFWLLL